MKPLPTIALLLAPLALGCAPTRGDHYRVGIDPAFTPEAQSAVLAALDDWSAKVPVIFAPFVGCEAVTDSVIDLHPGTPGPEGWLGVTYSDYTTGWTRVDGADILIDVRDAGPILQGIVAHELGHAMGLGHVTDATEPVLMYPASGGRWSPGVTLNDEEQWYRIRGRTTP